MSAVHLLIELESDVVISRTSATLGGHESLDYLPGATLRGAFAAFVRRSEPSRLDAALFSGAVRFGPAYPLAADGAISLPLPRSWHHPKGSGLECVTDLSTSVLAHSDQPVQLREGYLAGDRILTVAKTFSMRTAADASGRASEGLLFGYEAIRAGQRFSARIDCEDATLLGLVERWAASGQVRLGRSRTAEFGTVRLRTTEPRKDTASHGEPVAPGRVAAYCLSDLALRDPETGSVTLTPDRRHFAGLPDDARFEPALSFLRARAYSPFNGERRRPDLERQVIEAGSVIVFSTSTRVDRTRLEASARAGYGESLEDGLGQVLWNPAFLAPPKTLSAAPAASSAPASSPGPVGVPADALGAFVRAQLDTAERDRKIDAVVTRLGNVLHAFRLPYAQWGMIRDIGRAGGAFGTVCDQVREQTTRGVSGQVIWTRRMGTTSAAAELDTALQKLPDELQSHVGVLLERLSSRMMRENRGVDRG